MPEPRHFPPPWTITEYAKSFTVKGATGQALEYFYFEEEFGRRSADVRVEATAVIGCVSSETARSRMTQGQHWRNRRRASLSHHDPVSQAWEQVLTGVGL